MIRIKGFAVHTSYIDNVPQSDYFFGELSTQSLTYSKHKGYYLNASINNVGFLSFLSQEDGEDIEVPLNLSNHIVAVSDYVYNYTISNPGAPVEVTDLLVALSNQFNNTATNFVAGNIVDNTVQYIPEWVQWEHTTGALIRVWFVGAAFEAQYDEYEYVFIPPFNNLDDFFLGGVAVETLLSQITSSEIITKMQAAKGNHPETFIRLETYDYHDPQNTSRILPTNWGILGYGIAANNIDLLKESLIEFILDNSTHPREDWAEILPDLFKKTEFVLFPLWDQYAIEPRPTTPGIYSPISILTDVLSRLQSYLPDYLPFHINSYTTLMGNPFKSLSVASIGHIENRDGKFLLTDYFPDYINVSSTSLDFNRMSEDTKQWSLMIQELIFEAEKVTPISYLPLSISKIERNGIIYLSKQFQNVQYLVATKYSLENL